ncbi:GumC family protein [Sphingomicrobium aestuariivivum]|uniref:GumC family protein n=1 Tax=Sphingomicrobium aestuariivivum TaxID=1582356 RepID=UPI001FD6923B|nr:polysaccharide biosynthesis tyrosine autokinase [Sphingomicrobium aestuariivivum]MCJ8192031.1 polysaccharide biosynthesis tyrosine autokinase [Sphingomicrobium aestuariivivum]
MNNLPTTIEPGPGGPPTAKFHLDPMQEQHPAGSPLLDLFLLAWGHRYLILALMSASLVLGLLITASAQRYYTSSTTVQIERAPAQALEVEGLEVDRTTDWEFFETQYELLKSRRLAEMVVDDLGLEEDYQFIGGPEAGEELLQELSVDERRKAAVGRVMGGINVKPVSNSNIVTVDFTARDPQRAARVANAVAQQYMEMDLEQRFEATRMARDFLAGRLEEVRGRLEDSERQAADYARRTGLIGEQGVSSDASTTTIDGATLARLNAELTQATAERVRAESQFRSNNGGKAASEALSNDTISRLRYERAEKRGELSKLQSDFGPEYPKVVALKEQIGELDRQISAEQTRVDNSIGAGLEGEYLQALAAERALRAQVEQAKVAVLDEQQSGIGLKIIQRDIDTNRQLYEGLLQRYKEIGVAGTTTANRISVVDEAVVPAAPSSPNALRNIALSLLLGAAASFAAILGYEQLRRARLTPDDLASKLGVPLLGQTPKLLNKEGKRKSHVEQLALTESYYSALTTIKYLSEKGFPRSLFVTSSREKEGKSTTTLSLARDLASTGASVLLVDGDLRSPSIHALLSLPLDRGLSDHLMGKVGFADIVHETDTENLSAIFAGTCPSQPAQLLSGGSLPAFIDEALVHFDHVIIDGPPVLGLADALLFAHHAEGTLFVVESNRTPAATANAALDRLDSVHARIVGALLTKFDERRDTYGYGKRNGYSSYDYGSPRKAA